jgi:hypothetical protein
MRLETNHLLDIPTTGAYVLLKSYQQEISENYYRQMNKLITYPVIILSSLTSLSAGLNINKYITLGIALTTTIFAGFNQAINPLDKAQKANQNQLIYSICK